MFADVHELLRLIVLKDAYERGLRNRSKEQPNERALADAGVLLSQRQWTPEQLLHELPRTCADGMRSFNAFRTGVTADRVQQFLAQLLSRLYVEVFVHGNETE